MKKILIAFLIGILGLTTLTACADQDPEYAGVCVDPETEERLPDNYCEKDDPNYLAYAVMWYMLTNSSHPYPAVGSHVNKTHFVTQLPKNKTYTTGLPKTGGTSTKTWSSKTFGSSTTKSGTSWTKSGSSTTKSGGFGGSSSRSFSSGRR